MLKYLLSEISDYRSFFSISDIISILIGINDVWHENAFKNGKKLLVCGNGGSAADCDHIAGELLKGFAAKRELTGELRERMGEELASRLQMGLPAISLPAQGAIISAFCNDVDARTVYAQLTLALGRLFCFAKFVHTMQLLR